LNFTSLLPDIYRRLFDRFGCREWWPGETSFEVVVGCILTQNTSWENVERSLIRLKEASLLSPRGVLASPQEELIALTRSAGFSSQKPDRLKRLAGWWIGRIGEADVWLKALPATDGKIMRIGVAKERLPGSVTADLLREELLALNGVGPETVDAILLYAFGYPRFVVDKYKTRILERIGAVPLRSGYTAIQRFFEDSLPADVPLFNDFHAQLVTLGKRYCRARPVCVECPLREICDHGRGV